jgi:hypothetical protein
MAVASSLPRTSSDRSTLPVLLVAGLALVGVLGGVALALGELDALYISLSVIGALAILLDYRVGAVLLIIFLPVSESSLFPRAVLGLTGLNPLNILVGATLVSFLLRWNGMRFSEVLPPRLLWLYLVPICIAGLIGSRHVAEIPPQFFDNGSIRFIDAAGYLRDMLLKPLEMVLIALLVGAAVTRAQKPEHFIVPLIVSVWIMALVAIQYVVFANVRLADLADAEDGPARDDGAPRRGAAAHLLARRLPRLRDREHAVPAVEIQHAHDRARHPRDRHRRHPASRGGV